MGGERVVGKASRAWLLRMAEAEDRAASVAVGGMASDLEMLRVAPDRPRIFGKLVELARRKRGLSVEALATEADIELSDLLAIEQGRLGVPSPRAVFRLSDFFGFPNEKLLELSGLAEPTDEAVIEAAVLFAARLEPRHKLSKDEQRALEEFVKSLTKATDRGA